MFLQLNPGFRLVFTVGRPEPASTRVSLQLRYQSWWMTYGCHGDAQPCSIRSLLCKCMICVILQGSVLMAPRMPIRIERSVLSSPMFVSSLWLSRSDCKTVKIAAVAAHTHSGRRTVNTEHQTLPSSSSPDSQMLTHRDN